MIFCKVQHLGFFFFFLFLSVWNMARMDHQRCLKLPRWGNPGFQIVKKLTLDWSSYLASCILRVFMWNALRCRVEQAVGLKKLCDFFLPELIQFPPFIETHHTLKMCTRNKPSNHLQLITCTQCTIFHDVPSSPGKQQNQYQHWKTCSYAELLFPHQSGRSWKFVFTGSNTFSLKNKAIKHVPVWSCAMRWLSFVVALCFAIFCLSSFLSDLEVKLILSEPHKTIFHLP